MAEAYLQTLNEISDQINPEITPIINTIHSGISNLIEKLEIKMNSLINLNNNITIFEKENQTIKESLNNKAITIEQLNQTLKMKEEEIKELQVTLEKLAKRSVQKDKSSNPKKIIQRKRKYSKANEISDLKSALHKLKKRENRLIYFYNFLQARGYQIKEIYENQVKSICTELFTSNSDYNFTYQENEEYDNKFQRDKANVSDYIPIQDISKINPRLF